MPSYTGVVTSWPLAAGSHARFHVRTRSGLRLAVTVGARTRYFQAGQKRVNVTFVIPGELIELAGKARSSALVATKVWLFPRPRSTFLGVIARAPKPYQRNGVTSFELRVRRHRLTIDVFRSSTRFLGFRSGRAVLRSVGMGVHVRVRGVRGWPRTTIYATSVTVRRGARRGAPASASA